MVARDLLLSAGYSDSRIAVTCRSWSASALADARRAESMARRLAACEAAKGRFAGRADLTRAAQLGNIALTRLEVALGLAAPSDVVAAEFDAATRRLRSFPATYRHTLLDELVAASPARRPVIAARGYAAADSESNFGREAQIIARTADLRACAAIDVVRARRIAARPPAARLVSNSTERYLRREINRLTSGLRTAAHSHSSTTSVVARGLERAESSADTISASAAGMSNAYQRQAYRVASSDHRWFVSLDLLAVPRKERAAGGRIYLSPTVRVRQGRGTTLVTERLAGRRWS